MPFCDFAATGEVSWVLICHAGATSRVQEACGFGIRPRPFAPVGRAPRPGTGDRRRPGRAAGGHRTAESAMPIISAARMASVPFGTLHLDAVDRHGDEVVPTVVEPGRACSRPRLRRSAPACSETGNSALAP